MKTGLYLFSAVGLQRYEAVVSSVVEDLNVLTVVFAAVYLAEDFVHLTLRATFVVMVGGSIAAAH